MKEFKTFAIQGNVIDMAVGLIIGAEFGKIVSSLVQDVLMPPLGILIGNVDFKNMFILLKEGAKESGPYATLTEAQKAGAVTINIGQFLTTALSFVIVAFAIFMMVKAVNKLRSSSEVKN